MPDRAVSPVTARGAMSRRSFVGRGAAMLAAFTGGSAVLSACGGESASSTGGRTAVTFLAILPPENLTFTPELVAAAGGHFKDNKLDVTFESTKGSPPAIQTVLAGGAFLTRIDQMECMIANATKETPLRCIGTALRKPSLRWVSGGKTPTVKPEDFVGKTIGIPSEGGSSEWTLDLVLRSAGIDPKQVRRQVVGLTPATYNMVESGRIAAYAVGLDTALLVKDQHPDAVIFDPGTVIETGGQVYVTTEQALEENGDVLDRYLTSIRSAMESVLDDPTGKKTIATIKREFDVEALTNPGVAQESLKRYAELWTTGVGAGNLLSTPAEPWQAGYDELADAKLVKPSMDPAPWITNKLVAGG